MCGKKKPKIVVALAVYNGGIWLTEQINSILNQKDVDVTIYISIDPSSDSSEVICNEFSKKYKNIVVLPTKGKFGGAAKNFFRLIRDINLADFDYLSFSDQDDIWFEDKLKRAVRILKEKACDGYSSNVIAFWENGSKKLIVKSQPQRHWDYLFEAAGPGCTYVMSANLISKIKLNLIENWDDVNTLGLHDWFCYAYARANGFKWYIDSFPGMLYRQHSKNQVGVNSGLKAFMYRLNIIKQGWGIRQSALIAKLIGKSDDQFVRDWSSLKRRGFIKLSLNSSKCRRKFSEQITFFFLCILMAVFIKEDEGLCARTNLTNNKPLY